jgi:glutathione S-transferase
MEYISLVVIIALIEYLFFQGMAGKARGQYQIKAPAIIGNENFERSLRVQQNTLEQLIIFIPVIYLAGFYANEIAAALLGSLFLIGRPLYYKSYINDPSKRGPGMLIGYIPTVLLALMALVGVILRLFS